MKRCPDCGRDYNDDSLSFCLDDGAELLFGPKSFDEPPTAILHETDVPGEAATRAQIHTTEQTAVLPSGVAEVPKTKGFDKRLLLAPFVLAVIVLGGFLGYRYLSSANSEQINSIAVMPFQNDSGSADSDYLSDGLAESLIYRLSQLPDLKVSPTSSVFRYKGKQNDLNVVAKELGVDSVLTGRIVQRGDDLNISVNLVDTRNGRSLWGEKYERKMSELLATQAEIVGEIADNLRLKLSGESEKILAKKYTDNSQAYELYLKGQFHYSKRTKKDLLKAIDYFEQAIRLDPNFALAYDGIAASYSTMPSYGYIKSAEVIPKAKAAVQKALAIDPTLADAHSSLAQISSQYEWNWAEAEKEFKKALELNPNVAEIHYSYGLTFLAPVGRFDEAIAELKRALELEPLSIPIGANLASVLIYSGKYQEGLAQAIKTYDLEPGHPTASYHLGYAYCVNGMYEEAIKLTGKILADDSDNHDALSFIGYAYAKSGKTREARDVIARFRDFGKRQYEMFSYTALIYVGLGENDKAIAELEKAFTEREFYLHSLNIDPLWEPLRDEPKFKVIIERLNLPNSF